MDKHIFFICTLLRLFPAAAQTLPEGIRDAALHDVPASTQTDTAPMLQGAETAVQAASPQPAGTAAEALAYALRHNLSTEVAQLLPAYRSLPETAQDPLLLVWAAAVMARERGDYPASARLYRALLAERPDWTGVRLQAVTAFLLDKDWLAAQTELRRLQSDGGLPEKLRSETEQLLAHIREQERWQFSGAANFVSDKNLNNAPDNPDLGNGWRAEAPQSGRGLAANLSAGRKWLQAQGRFYELRLEGGGRYYWNNRRYNEANVRLLAGAGYQDGRNSAALLPFFEQAWYAGGRKDDKALQRFSHSAGVAAEASHRFSPRWQGSVYGEAALNRYRTRPHLDGSTRLLALTGIYRPHPRQVWFVGADWRREQTRDPEDAYIRTGVRAGWLQDWQGFNTRLSLSYGRKKHRAEGIFGKVQANRELSVQAAVWHPSLHWRGFTPKLNWHYTRTRSNIPFYGSRKQRLFMEIGRQF